MLRRCGLAQLVQCIVELSPVLQIGTPRDPGAGVLRRGVSHWNLTQIVLVALVFKTDVYSSVYYIYMKSLHGSRGT